jgi:hypothetical protein
MSQSHIKQLLNVGEPSPHPLLKDGAELTLAKINWKGKSIWWPGIKFSSFSHMMRNVEDALEESQRTKQIKAKLFLSGRAERKKNPNVQATFVVQLLAIDSVRFYSDDRDVCSFYVYALEDHDDDGIRQKAFNEAITIVEAMVVQGRNPIQTVKLSPAKKNREFLPQERKNGNQQIIVSTQKNSISSRTASSPPKIHLRDGIWLESLSRLISYKEEHGDSNVPSKWRNDPALGEWVQVQRKEFRIHKHEARNYLTKEKIHILNAIGFEWSGETTKKKKRRRQPRKKQIQKTSLIANSCREETDMICQASSPTTPVGKNSGECIPGEIWAVAKEKFFPGWTYDKRATRTLYNFFHHRPGLENKSYTHISEDESLKYGVDYFFHIEEMKEYARTNFNWVDPHSSTHPRRVLRKREMNDTNCVKKKTRKKRMTKALRNESFSEENRDDWVNSTIRQHLDQSYHV